MDSYSSVPEKADFEALTRSESRLAKSVLLNAADNCIYQF